MRDYDVNEPVKEIGDVGTPMNGATIGYDYKPNKQEILREYELRIKFLSVGCVVSVGCKEIPFRSVKEAMGCINDYVNNPYEESKRWQQIFVSEE